MKLGSCDQTLSSDAAVTSPTSPGDVEVDGVFLVERSCSSPSRSVSLLLLLLSLVVLICSSVGSWLVGVGRRSGLRERWL